MYGGGYQEDSDDEEENVFPQGGHHAGGGANALLQHLAGMAGVGGAGGWNPLNMGPPRAPPRAYDAYMKAYSVAMLPGRERENLSYGGKIIMPPSALANLTALDLESPWTFQLRNPSNPAASTHAGVLEFIAQEGVVHLPFWMMKTLRLDEGDPIRITGARLPKGKRVKIQAQSVHFLEISDPKAVLEQALRNFSVLTQGDIIEIIYNGIRFEILIMEILPEGAGISVLDTDLEVDFAAPKGYVEPARPQPAAAPTMADKLKIDLHNYSPGSSRPPSATGANAGTDGGAEFESFKGAGQTLGGRKTKGKGLKNSTKKIEEVDPASRIIRTDKQRIVTNDTLGDGRPIPAALNLPFGKLFFGFQVIPPPPPPEDTKSPSSPKASPQPPVFSGSGNTLSGRPAPSTGPAPTASSSSKAGPKAKSAAASGASTGSGRRARSPEVIEIDSD